MPRYPEPELSLCTMVANSDRTGREIPFAYSSPAGPGLEAQPRRAVEMVLDEQWRELGVQPLRSGVPIPRTPKWTARWAEDRMLISDTDGKPVYDGPCNPPPMWVTAARRRGRFILLIGYLPGILSMSAPPWHEVVDAYLAKHLYGIDIAITMGTGVGTGTGRQMNNRNAYFNLE